MGGKFCTAAQHVPNDSDAVGSLDPSGVVGICSGTTEGRVCGVVVEDSRRVMEQAKSAIAFGGGPDAKSRRTSSPILGRGERQQVMNVGIWEAARDDIGTC